MMSMMSGGSHTRVKVFFNPSIHKDAFWSLFNIVPGLVSCDLVDMTQSGALSTVVYNSYQAAAHAVDRINGFEYPPGSQIMVQMDGGDMGPGGGFDQSAAAGGGNNAVPAHIQGLISTIKEATQAINSAGFGSAMGGGGNYNFLTNNSAAVDAQKVCSARLPAKQPLCEPNKRMEERLFFVLKEARDCPDPAIITDVFARFGNLIDATCLRGKKCGYARYADKASANQAVAVLNNQDLLGSRMKIEIADDERGSKRRRID